MKIRFLLYYICIIGTLNAQVDSLKNILTACETDSCKANSYLSIAKTFLNKENDSVFFYIEKSETYSTNYLQGKAAAKNLRATVEFRLGNYEKSRNYFLQALTIAKKQQDSLKIGAYLNNAGLTHTYQGNYEEALNLLMQALSIREQINDPKISSTYNNIGVAYERLDQLEKAANFQLLALKEKEQQGNQSKISNTLNNLGIIYRKRDMYDSSFYYYNRALSIALKLDNLDQISNAYNNLGALFFAQDKAEEAEKYYTLSINIKLKLGKKFELRNSYSNLCRLYLKKGNNAKAKKYFDLAESQKDSSDSKSSNLEQLYLKVKLETALGKYKEALQSSNEALLLYKEIINAENISNIEELNTKYETEKKEQEIKLLNLENTLQQTELDQSALKSKFIKTSFTIGAIILILIILVIFILYRIKRKTNSLLTKKNDELVEVNAIKDQLFSVVSHDLKNPVFAFKNLTNSLAIGLDQLPKETVQNLMEQLNNTSNSLYDSLNNILSWSLSQQNKITVTKSTVSIKALFDDVIQLHKIIIDEKELNVTNGINDQFIIDIDPNILSTVFRNILMNAIKFSSKFGTITISNINNIISISDEGIGMSEEDVLLLFDIKNDVKKIGDSPEKGTGLGLVLCKELLEKMDASIQVSSQLNIGTTVNITIP
jgi:signal transduction histidine kinase/Flp pilus assembly protein TadD